mmetsp:Transcript_16786/g.41031  ORF Transcript_16786/g.41031 Transcript_16786/m.41031 type:complete len:130 (+) Transcript_16786:1887-2276(+)
MYLFTPVLVIFLVIVNFLRFFMLSKLFLDGLLFRINDTEAKLVPLFSFRNIRSSIFVARITDKFVKPNTKQIESKTLDFPEPLIPVIELNFSSKFKNLVFEPYDLNPSIISSLIVTILESIFVLEQKKK